MSALILFINQLSALATAITSAVPSIIGACSIIAAFLPPPEMPGKMAKVHKIVNMLAFNFKHATNAKDV